MELESFGFGTQLGVGSGHFAHIMSITVHCMCHWCVWLFALVWVLLQKKKAAVNNSSLSHCLGGLRCSRDEMAGVGPYCRGVRR